MALWYLGAAGFPLVLADCDVKDRKTVKVCRNMIEDFYESPERMTKR